MVRKMIVYTTADICTTHKFPNGDEKFVLFNDMIAFLKEECGYDMKEMK